MEVLQLALPASDGVALRTALYVAAEAYLRWFWSGRVAVDPLETIAVAQLFELDVESRRPIETLIACLRVLARRGHGLQRVDIRAGDRRILLDHLGPLFLERGSVFRAILSE